MKPNLVLALDFQKRECIDYWIEQTQHLFDWYKVGMEPSTLRVTTPSLNCLSAANTFFWILSSQIFLTPFTRPQKPYYLAIHRHDKRSCT